MDANATQIVETDILIVGTGPAGGSLGAFLGGVRSILLNKYSSTAETPRAHITNVGALECMRDIGLEDACMAVATHNEYLSHTRYVNTFLGEEYARVYSWGNDPKHIGKYMAASPCTHCDLPQTKFEPILLHAAITHRNTGQVRFNTEWLSSTEDSQGVLSYVRDRLTGAQYRIRSKFLVGCDGANSAIAKQLNLRFDVKPGGGLAINVHFEMDLEGFMPNRISNLTWTLVPGAECPRWGRFALVRMVRPWTEWIAILFPEPGFEGRVSVEEYIARTKELMGTGDLPLKLLTLSFWNVNEQVAENYQVGRTFALGDAVHRHPPFNGLGSNTCVQDAYNLAWKLKYVLAGWADKSLLDTFTDERRPVGVQIVTRANDGFRDHSQLWSAIGATPGSNKDDVELLFSPDAKGKARRKALAAAVERTKTEFHALGTEMGQTYRSAAIYADQEAAAYAEPANAHPIFDYTVSTYPGRRLPHAWLTTLVPSKKVSTHDLAGKGFFTLFTGPSGLRWKEALQAASSSLNDVPCRAWSIGLGGDYVDTYGDWANLSQVEEDGCVLVRPDRFICWRSMDMSQTPEQDLRRVLAQILGYKTNGCNGSTSYAM